MKVMKLSNKNLRKEIGKNCVCFNLRRAARKVTQRFDRTLQQSGLKTNQFSILMASYDPDGIRLTRMAKTLGMERTTLTRNLAFLESLGMVSIEPGDDRRERKIRITEKGAGLLEKALPLWQQAQREIVELIGGGKIEGLLTGLHEVARKL
jgi:DNA-binding MarR family transcriptional regulator